MAGTKQGITAIQMDLKNDGLKHEIVKEAFAITKEARFQILDAILLKAIPEPRKELAKTAPKMIQMHINPDKIREVIGSGGKVIGHPEDHGRHRLQDRHRRRRKHLHRLLRHRSLPRGPQDHRRHRL